MSPPDLENGPSKDLADFQSVSMNDSVTGGEYDGAAKVCCNLPTIQELSCKQG